MKWIIGCKVKVDGVEKTTYIQYLDVIDRPDVVNRIRLFHCYNKKLAMKFYDEEEAERFAQFCQGKKIKT